MPLHTKKFFLLIGVLLLILSLSACGGKKEKSEKEILADIKLEDYYLSGDYGLEVKSHTIDKRQTNAEDKTDYVWFSFEAENDEFTYHASCELTYVLYNDGWMLETVEYMDGLAEAKDYDPFSGEELDAVIIEEAESNLAEWEFREKFVNTNWIDYFFTGKTVMDNFLRTTYDIRISYAYAPETGWSKQNFAETVIAHELGDITGEWSGYAHGSWYHNDEIEPDVDSGAPINITITSVEPIKNEGNNKETSYSVHMNYEWLHRSGVWKQGSAEVIFERQSINFQDDQEQIWYADVDAIAPNCALKLITGNAAFNVYEYPMQIYAKIFHTHDTWSLTRAVFLE